MFYCGWLCSGGAWIVSYHSQLGVILKIVILTASEFVPIDGLLSRFGQQLISLREVSTSKESPKAGYPKFKHKSKD